MYGQYRRAEARKCIEDESFRGFQQSVWSGKLERARGEYWTQIGIRFGILSETEMLGQLFRLRRRFLDQLPPLILSIHSVLLGLLLFQLFQFLLHDHLFLLLS
jgi:hypothetical protein